MKIQQAKNTTRPTLTLVHPTKEKMFKSELVNPYSAFEGVDGKTTFKISYPVNLNKATNCYAFALGIRAKGDPRRDYYPGFLSGYKLELDMLEDSERRVISDIEALGRKVYEVIQAVQISKQLPKASKGSVWIKALKAPMREDGLHFMVKNELSGRWIHKLGWEMPPKVVVRNLGVRSDFDELLKRFPEYKEKMNLFSFEEQMILRESLGNMYSLSNSILESDDDASYYAFPENATDLEEYKPVWVMRISE